VVTLADAIRSMTSLPATVFAIPERGLVREGLMADMVVFDLATVADHATYTDPHRLSEGMVHVLINGMHVVADGQFTDARAGRVLRR
jgi:N-acyl-D-aspartate/D-glutamate deacylase